MLSINSFNYGLWTAGLFVTCLFLKTRRGSLYCYDFLESSLFHRTYLKLKTNGNKLIYYLQLKCVTCPFSQKDNTPQSKIYKC